MRSFRPRSKAWPQPLAEDRLAARAERAMTSSDDSIYERHLGRNAANHAALTPLGFLARTAGVFPNRVSAIPGARRYTWADRQSVVSGKCVSVRVALGVRLIIITKTYNQSYRNSIIDIKDIYHLKQS